MCVCVFVSPPCDGNKFMCFNSLRLQRQTQGNSTCQVRSSSSYYSVVLSLASGTLQRQCYGTNVDDLHTTSMIQTSMTIHTSTPSVNPVPCGSLLIDRFGVRTKRLSLTTAPAANVSCTTVPYRTVWFLQLGHPKHQHITCTNINLVIVQQH